MALTVRLRPARLDTSGVTDVPAVADRAPVRAHLRVAVAVPVVALSLRDLARQPLLAARAPQLHFLRCTLAFGHDAKWERILPEPLET